MSKLSARKVSIFTKTATDRLAVTSASLHQWATSPTNLSIVTAMAKSALEKNPKADPIRFATYLMAVAMG